MNIWAKVGLVVLAFATFIFWFIPALWFLPAIIAFYRKHRNVAPIAILSFFSPLTIGILWVVALVWAFTADTKTSVQSTL